MSIIVDTIVDAEVLPALDRPAAERLDKRIRLLVGTINDSITKLHELVQEAKNSGAHVALGFPSWTAYLADVFTIDVRLERGARAELVSYLSGEGISNRAIADMIGSSLDTVNRDVRATERNRSVDPDRKTMGKDGKERRRPTPRPKPAAPEPEPEPADDADDPADKLAELMSVTDLLGSMVDRFIEVWRDFGDGRSELPEREGTAISREMYRVHLITCVLLGISPEGLLGNAAES